MIINFLGRLTIKSLNDSYAMRRALPRSFRSYSKFDNSDGGQNSTLSETIRSLNIHGLPEKTAPGPVVKVPIMIRLKEGIQHYWHGSKLLAYETKISSKLIYKLMKGETLIRREKRQLLRTTSDLLRLVPFIIIAIIPFLEFALPLILKIFPNMLPSTFEDKLAAVSKFILKYHYYIIRMKKFASKLKLNSKLQSSYKMLWRKWRLPGLFHQKPKNFLTSIRKSALLANQYH